MSVFEFAVGRVVPHEHIRELKPRIPLAKIEDVRMLGNTVIEAI
jgi:hypothetical protein